MSIKPASSDPLLQPYRLKHLVLRNRLMSTAHEPAYSEDGMPTERYRLYHEEKAKGGIALTMTAGSAIVSEDSPAAFGNLHAYRDEIVPWLAQLSDACHAHDTAVMIQLTHLGRRTNWNKADWLPVLAPSMVREPAHRAFPKEAEDWDIERIVSAYGTAAQRMQAAGLDGIELEAYGHLMDGFWSPATNRRDDEYGGSLDNRLRFTRLVLDEVRARVGAAFIVGIRMVADENWEKGLSREEGMEIARRLVASGQIDFLNIIRGHIETDAALSKVIPIHGTPSAPHLDFAGDVRQHTGFPVFHAARINDVATARHAVATGKLDMVGMTRAHLADPHIGRKTAEGREDTIRPCVGATYCLDRIYEGHEALCVHNAATGREATMPHDIAPVDQAAIKRFVIVGAGPAGLEAARVASARGHEVHVLEAQDKPGGQICLVVRQARRAEMIGIVDWRMRLCEQAGVRFSFNVLADRDDVLALDPDVVIIATGGVPNTDVLDFGSDLAISSWDILSGDTAPAASVLLFDDNGSHSALQAAFEIAGRDSALEIITPERFFAPEIGGLNHVAYAESFETHGVIITINRRLVGITRAGNGLIAHIGSDYTGRIDERRIDQVVIDHGTLPVDDLYFDLKSLSINRGAVDYRALIAGKPQSVVKNHDGAFKLFRIGDAVAARNIHAAIYDALRLVKDL